MVGTFRRFLDKSLSYLASGQSRLGRLIVTVLHHVRPSLAAVVEFRRGRLSEAKRLSSEKKNSRVYVRATQMLMCMQDQFPLPNKPDGLHPFNRRVLYVVHSSGNFDPNGYAVRTRQTLQALREQGLVVASATRLGYPWDLSRHATQPDLTHTSAEGQTYFHQYDPSGGISQPEMDYVRAYADYLIKLALDHKATVIHANSNFLNGLAATSAARQLGIQSIYEMRGLWHLTRASRDPQYENSEHFAYCQSMELQAARSAGHVVAISSALEHWLEKHGVSGNKISVIPNAAEITNDNPIEFRQKRTQDKKVEIGYVGALTEYEGLETLIDAIPLITAAGKDPYLSIAGDGPYAEQLKQRVGSKGLTSRVTFLGRLPARDAKTLYQKFDVCPLPRQSAPLTELIPPLKPFEIMLHKVPLIVSDIAPLREIASRGHSALIIPPGSAQALAIAVLDTVNNPDATQARVEHAYASVIEERNWTANGPRYAKLYQRQRDPQERLDQL